MKPKNPNNAPIPELNMENMDIESNWSPKQDKQFPLIVAIGIIIIGGLLVASLRFHFVERGTASEWCYQQAINQIK